ncbi:hypothetical protein BKA93DRAFT_742214 [Sparassis latifolia]
MSRIYARATTSSVLWGHLLQRKNDSSVTPAHSTSASSLSPIVPLDKAGTSMRILLHDTQANLEKFSDRVAKLTIGVHDTKREIVTMQKLFEQDHEKLLEETVNLVNRCQMAIQKTLGNPTQTNQVETLRVDLAGVDSRLQALDKKIDVLHMVCHLTFRTCLVDSTFPSCYSSIRPSRRLYKRCKISKGRY